MNQKLFMLAVHLKVMNLIYHNAHNLFSGPTFFADHPVLGDFYEAVDGDYDNVIERAIGLGMPEVANLKHLLHVVDAHISALPEQFSFQIAAALEVHLCELCNEVDKDPFCTPGLREMIGAICDNSEIRQYKIKMRSK